MVFSLPLTAFALETYQFSIDEPTCSDNQGYILLLVENVSTGSRTVHCLSWTLLPVYTDNEVTYNATEMNITINSNNSVNFVGRSNGNYQLSAGFCRSQSGDNKRTTYFSLYENSIGLTYNYTSIGSAYKIVGFQLYGNAVLESHSLGSNNNAPFSVTWGSDREQVQKLTDILAQLQILAQNDTKILAKLESILSDTSNIDATLLRLETLLEQLVNAKGESTFEEPSTESISDYNKAEDELVSGADDTSDIEQQIEDFEIDDDSSSLIWGIIQGYLNQNELVFGLVVGVLCLGIIALILNR